MSFKDWWNTKPECHWIKYSIIVGIIFLIMYNIAFWEPILSGKTCGGDMGCSGWSSIFYIPTVLLIPIIYPMLMVLPDITPVAMYIISSLANFFLGFIIGLIVWKIKKRKG